MRKAMLCYVCDDPNTNHEKSVTLDEGSLYYIDRCVAQYKNERELLANASYKTKIENFQRENQTTLGRLKIRYVKDTFIKENLPFLFNEKEPIYLRLDLSKEQIQEVEKARKLLFQSRDQIFARMMLQDSTMAPTFDYRIKLRPEEVKKVKEYSFPIRIDDGEYFMHFEDILKCRIYFQKLKGFRLLYEDMLESWKENLLNLPDEELYYYSRHLRHMIHQYENQRTKGYRIVHDLVFYTNDLKRFSGKIHFSSPHYKIVNKPFLFSPFQKKIEEY